MQYSQPATAQAQVLSYNVARKLDEIQTLHRSSYDIASEILNDALIELGVVKNVQKIIIKIKFLWALIELKREIIIEIIPEEEG